MRAVRYHHTGGPEVLVVEDVPDPEPGPGQLLVEVQAAGVNYLDAPLRAGQPGMPPVPLPSIPGFDAVGLVRDVAADVAPAWKGRRVVGTTTGGAYAELVVMNVGEATVVPEATDDHTAEALFVHGSTALGILNAARVQRGDTVLIPAAAGGVGTLLVQLAKYAGATVVAATSSSSKADIARRLGADITLDYTDDDWPDALRSTLNGGLEIALDTVGGRFTEQALSLLTPTTGRIVLCGTSGGIPTITAMDLLRHNVTAIGYSNGALPAEHRRSLALEAMQRANDGTLTPIIGLVVPFERAGEAHQVLEDRANVGKILLTPR